MTSHTHAPDKAAEPAAPIRADVGAPRLPMMISGVFNILFAIGWLWAFFLFGPISLGLAILAIVEFKTASDLAKITDADRLRWRTKLIGVLEICTGAIGNLPSLICGIIVLTSLPKLQDVVPQKGS